MPETDGALIDVSEGMKIHYKAVHDNILFLKRQQWTITNHALVLFAAVTALSKGVNPVERSALTFIAFIGLAYVYYCMVHTQVSMTRYYGNLYDAQQKFFSPEERETMDMLRKRPGFNYAGGFIWGLMVANAVAFAVSIYFMWAKGGFPVLNQALAASATVTGNR